MSEDNREPPPGVRVLSNGAWVSQETGRFVKGMPAVTTAITKENSHDLLRIRKQKQLDGMLEANRRLYDMDPEYWGSAAVAMYELALEKKGTGSVKAFEAVGKATGNLAAGRQDDSGPAPGTARIEFDAEFIAEVKARIDSHRGE